MRYVPNPAHKRETTVAGPARWRPDKLPCPDDLTVEERTRLLEEAVPVDPNDPCSRRFGLRRGPVGPEFFDAKCTREEDGEPEFHGHPASYVPGKILRRFRKLGLIDEGEYRRLVRRFACP